jgi:Ca2+-transporting ATPase
MGATSLAVGWFYWSTGRANWQTMLFTTLTLSQLALALAIRSEKRSLFRVGFLSNPYMASAIIGSILLQLAAVYVGPFQSVLNTLPLSGSDLAICLVASTVTFWMLEAQKLVRSRKNKAKAPPIDRAL